jgi:hypothetical protein
MLVATGAPALLAALQGLVRLRMVFVVGLPGTGKSLLLRELAHLAHAAGRSVHLLQWDVVRPVLEASAAGARYPMVAGVTDPVVRKAAGGWVRAAIAEWDRAHRGVRHLLLGEAPFVGNRFVELARREHDDAELLLAGPAARFVLPVPSREVRAHLEAERARRAVAPRHPREREDAPPDVLRALWRDLVAVGLALGLPSPAGEAYDPDLYRSVYAHVLRDRTTEVVALDTVLPTDRLSVYDFDVPCREVVPAPDEPDRYIAAVEDRYPDRSVLLTEADRWWAG